MVSKVLVEVVTSYM